MLTFWALERKDSVVACSRRRTWWLARLSKQRRKNAIGGIVRAHGNLRKPEDGRARRAVRQAGRSVGVGGVTYHDCGLCEGTVGGLSSNFRNLEESERTGRNGVPWGGLGILIESAEGRFHMKEGSSVSGDGGDRGVKASAPDNGQRRNQTRRRWLATR